MANATKNQSKINSNAVTKLPTLLDRLRENVDKFGSKMIFSFIAPGVDAGRIVSSISYQSLENQTTALAQRLLQEGLKKGDRALLIYPPSLDYSIAFLACLKAGVVCVPCFPPNPSRRDTLKMFSKITESCDAKYALTNLEYNHLTKLAGVKDAITRFKRPLGGTWPENLNWITTDDMKGVGKASSKMAAGVLLPTVTSDDLAFLQYTSGSTSEPKGVMISHGNLAHNLTIITNELKAKDDTIVVSWLPQYHDMGLIGSYLGVIYCGGSGYYMSPLSFLQRPMLWMEAVSKFKATHLQAPNFAFKLTARKFQPSDYVNKPLQLQSVRHIINAAEPVDEEAIDAFYKAFAPFGLQKVIYPTYGLAEHTVFVCSGGTQRISVWREKLQVEGVVSVVTQGTPNTDRSSLARLVGCGYPARQNVDVRIIDRETCQELSPGQVGEIWINSPSKAAGYFGKESETKKDFHAPIDNTDNATYLRTGDLGFFYNDELFICGRLKDLIIVAGRNYYPQDIEATAEATSDLLRPGCSAAFTIDSTHEGGEEVALIMELRDIPNGSVEIQKVCDPLANQVRSAINQEHSLGIAQILFLKTKTVPKTSSGKIARAWCRKGFLAGTLQTVYKKSFKGDRAVTSFEVEPGQTAPLQAPLSSAKVQEIRSMSRDDIMDKLRLDVARTAQIPPDSIDNDTALVTILDSLSISQFKGRLELAYGVKISDEYLFGENITLKKLGEVVQLGYAPDDNGGSGAGGVNEDVSTPMMNAAGKAEGLAGVLGCPPGVRVCCVIQ
jgi:acyl-CoA synthetase (AMP-forming)/AMP-acid ligase II/acyl carrier protein